MSKNKFANIEPVKAPVYTSYPKLVKGKFKDLVKEQYETKVMIKALEEREKELAEQLTALMITARAERAMVGNLRTKLCEGKHVSIDGGKLLQKGVSSTVIQECTNTSKYHYVRIDMVSEEAASALVE